MTSELCASTAFAIARLPRIVFGPGRLEELPGIVREFGSSALVIGRPAFLEGERWAVIERALSDAGIQVVREPVPDGEPSPALVDEIVARHRASEPGAVVGVGGGSVLDTAKAVAGLLIPGNSVTDHLEGIPPQLAYPGPAVPFVAVPTTAGTGSEATKNAVLSVRGPDGYKRSFRDEQLVARVAIVDPDLLDTCPPELIAANGMDAVTQLLESYVSQRSGPFTDALALSGLRAARDGLLEWHAAASAGRHGDETAAARARMAYAALLSGICLAQAGLGAVHGLASPLGAQFPIPHGVACGAVLAAATRVNVAALEARDPGSAALARYAELGRALGAAAPDAGDVTARGRLVELLDDWRLRLAVPGLATFGIGEEAVAGLVADSRGSSMRTNPIPLSDDEVAAILRASF